MCNSSLGVWKNTLSICPFVPEKKFKKKEEKTMLLIEHDYIATMVCVSLVCLTC
jgi:hypothetical protein